MGQFEYSVPLSSVKPEDIQRIAKEYREKQERDSMIRYEFGMLSLDSSHSKKDQDAINSFIESKINEERLRILSEIESSSPGYDTVSIAKFKLRKIITGREY